MTATLKKSFILHSPDEKNWFTSEVEAKTNRLQTYLLAERILLCSDAGIVVLECLGKYLGVKAHLLRQCGTAFESLHQTTADVVFTMPLNLLRGLAIENEADGVLCKTS